MQKDEIAIIKLHRALVNAEVLLHIAVDVDSSRPKYLFIADRMGLLVDDGRHGPLSVKDRIALINNIQDVLSSIIRIAKLNDLIQESSDICMRGYPTMQPESDVTDD